MKKLWWIGLVAIVIIAGMIPYRQHNHLLIKNRCENVYRLLLKPEQWRKWHPQVKAAWGKDTSAIKINKQNLNFAIQTPEVRMQVKVNGFGFDVAKEFANRLSVYSFTILPNTNTKYTDVQLIAVSSLFKNIGEWINHDSPLTDMKNLKQFMENDVAYYGYDIRTHTAVDTNIVVEQRIVSLSSRNATIASIRDDLYGFVTKNRLKITQPIMADMRVLSQDSIRVMVGLSVTGTVKPAGHIQNMKIPKQSKMLTVLYRGKYGNRQAIYTVLRDYMHDHELLAPEVPYEKYLDNKIPLSDTDNVFIQIIAPLQ
jgi:effector-binding domain-containing protein